MSALKWFYLAMNILMVKEIMPLLKDFIATFLGALVPMDHSKSGWIPISKNFELVNFRKSYFSFFLRRRFVVVTINHHQS